MFIPSSCALPSEERFAKMHDFGWFAGLWYGFSVEDCFHKPKAFRRVDADASHKCLSLKEMKPVACRAAVLQEW
jgi:hypothetical protein